MVGAALREQVTGSGGGGGFTSMLINLFDLLASDAEESP